MIPATGGLVARERHRGQYNISPTPPRAIVAPTTSANPDAEQVLYGAQAYWKATDRQALEARACGSTERIRRSRPTFCLRWGTARPT
jgi:hypothetical protein